MLFGEFWFERELCILFADTNLGKSILAVQINNSISRGEQIRGFKLEAIKQPILYFDFELTDKQFVGGYSIKNEAEKRYEQHYDWDKNFLRTEIDPDAEIPEKQTFNDYITQIKLNPNKKPLGIMQCYGKTIEVYAPNQYQVITLKPNENNLKKISIRGSNWEKNSSGRFFVKHLERLDVPSETLFKVPDMGNDAVSYRYFYAAPKGKKNGGYYQGMPTRSKVTKKQYANFYNFEKEYNNVAKQGGVHFRNGKKPEELMAF
jgi:hypothetical protein